MGLAFNCASVRFECFKHFEWALFWIYRFSTAMFSLWRYLVHTSDVICISCILRIEFCANGNNFDANQDFDANNFDANQDFGLKTLFEDRRWFRNYNHRRSSNRVLRPQFRSQRGIPNKISSFQFRNNCIPFELKGALQISWWTQFGDAERRKQSISHGANPKKAKKNKWIGDFWARSVDSSAGSGSIRVRRIAVGFKDCYSFYMDSTSKAVDVCCGDELSTMQLKLEIAKNATNVKLPWKMNDFSSNYRTTSKRREILR